MCFFQIFPTNLILMNVKISFIRFSFMVEKKKKKQNEPLHFFMESKFIINFFV